MSTGLRVGHTGFTPQWCPTRVHWVRSKGPMSFLQCDTLTEYRGAVPLLVPSFPGPTCPQPGGQTVLWEGSRQNDKAAAGHLYGG